MAVREELEIVGDGLVNHLKIDLDGDRGPSGDDVVGLRVGETIFALMRQGNAE